MTKGIHIKVLTLRGIMNYYPATPRAAADILRRAINTEGCRILKPIVRPYHPGRVGS